MELAGPVPDLQPSETISPPDPYLSDFTRLGEQVYLYTPPLSTSIITVDASGSETVDPDPDLIILCSWMYAASKYIAKYTKIYQSTYASSPILLLRQDGGDFFWRTKAQQMKNLDPAISTIRELSTKKDAEKFRVLMHVFSNGGAWTACQLTDAYRLASSSPSPDEQELLPISALVLDSTPSLPNPSASHTAICEALPKNPPAVRALGSVLVWGYINLAQALDGLLGTENITLNIRRRLNDPNGAFMQNSLHRVYMYSQADALIPAKDVEKHGKEAGETMGSERVRMEDFISSRHVSHMVTDPKRYWAVIDGLWKNGASI